MDIPNRDLTLISTLRYQADATPQFEVLKSCLIWPDERPEQSLCSAGQEFLNDLWIVRGFIHRAVPIARWGLDPAYFQAVWQDGQRLVGSWPGFRRMVLSPPEQEYLSRCLADPGSEL